jgi:hypothetical protein
MVSATGFAKEFETQYWSGFVTASETEFAMASATGS